MHTCPYVSGGDVWEHACSQCWLGTAPCRCWAAHFAAHLSVGPGSVWLLHWSHSVHSAPDWQTAALSPECAATQHTKLITAYPQREQHTCTECTAVPSLCVAAAVSPPASSLLCPAHTVCSAWSNTATQTCPSVNVSLKRVNHFTESCGRLTSTSASSGRWTKALSL